MEESVRRKPSSRRDPHSLRRSWCCSFTVPPSSPETIFSHAAQKTVQPKSEKLGDSLLKPSANSIPNSPQSSKSGPSFPGRIHPRRILSPGRVSPIDQPDSIQEMEQNPSQTQLKTQSFRAPTECFGAPDDGSSSSGAGSGSDRKDAFDVRLNLRGKNGDGLVLEMNSEVLCANSETFSGLICEYKKGGCSGSRKICRIEVPDVENLSIFRETIELMFEDDITKHLMRIGVYRCIDILEVSAGIMFNRGVLCCLEYIEAVPWTEEEEEKLRSLFARIKFDDTTTRDILTRIYALEPTDLQQNLARQLVSSITTCADASGRNELKSLVKGLLSKSSVYEKDLGDIKRVDLYTICQSCLDSLLSLLEEASNSIPREKLEKKQRSKPLIERISRQVDNINWLLEILLDRQMAEDFVDMWANQGELLAMHHSASPMVRYELSRVSAYLFIAIGNRQLHCCSEARSALLQAWFSPMLLDFGWLQRCRKGLDMRAMEEALGQTLLTLPLKQQHVLFMEWFQCFSKHGTECPNLSKAFQIWWRRSFLRGSETYAVESR